MCFFFFFLRFWRRLWWWWWWWWWWCPSSSSSAVCSKPIFFSLFFSFFLSRGKKEWRNYKPKANFFLPFFFFLFSFEREKILAKLFLKKDASERVIYSSHTHIKVCCCAQRWKRRHRKPGRPSSRANTRTASSSVRTRECPRVRFVVVVVASRGIF